MKYLVVLLTLSLTGCASIQDTPAQAAMRAKVIQCKPQMVNVSVYSDGSVYGLGDPRDVRALVQCLRSAGVPVLIYGP